MGDFERLEAALDSLEVASLASLGGLALDLELEPFGPVLLRVGRLHPFGLLVAVEALDLEGGASIAQRSCLVTLLAPEATRLFVNYISDFPFLEVF